MTIEERLTRAADEMTVLAESFEPPGIQHGWALRWRRRVVAGIAVAAVAASLVVAGVWGVTEVITREIEPADVEPAPALEWIAVTQAPPVDRVVDLWATGDGYALWSGDEVWISPDGQAWELATETPPGVFSSDSSHALEENDGVWIGIGQTPQVWRNEGSGWQTIALPTDYDAGNDLLLASVRPSQITSSDTGIVVAGIVRMTPDPEAVLGRFAPDVVGGQVVFDDTVTIQDAAGNVVMSVPYEEIDERLTGGAPLLGGVLWHSEDGTTWQQVASLDQLPLFLDADNTGFVAVTGQPGIPSQLWTSLDGTDWTSTAVTLTEPTSGNFALDNGAVIAAEQRSLSAIDRDGHSQTISVGDAFTNLDSAWVIGMLHAGPYGIVAAAYDSSTDSVPVVAVWYSPDTEHWSRQDLQDVFGAQGTILIAVGDHNIVIGHDPRGEAFLSLQDGFTIWIGTH